MRQAIQKMNVALSDVQQAKTLQLIPASATDDNFLVKLISNADLSTFFLCVYRFISCNSSLICTGTTVLNSATSAKQKHRAEDREQASQRCVCADNTSLVNALAAQEILIETGQASSDAGSKIS